MGCIHPPVVEMPQLGISGCTNRWGWLPGWQAGLATVAAGALLGLASLGVAGCGAQLQPVQAPQNRSHFEGGAITG